MSISYQKLWIILIENNIPKSKFHADMKIATGTMKKAEL